MKNPFKLKLMSDSAIEAIKREAEVRGQHMERSYTRLSEVDGEVVSQWDDQFYNSLQEMEQVEPEKDKKGIIGRVKEAVRGNWTIISGSRMGVFRRVLTLGELSTIQSAVFLKCQSDPHAQNIVNNIEFYTLGSGTRVECQVKEIKEVIDNFRKLNKMGQKEKKMVRSCFINGEYFARYVDDGKGNLLVRSVPPSQIVDIDSGSDVETPLAYKRTWADSVGEVKHRWIADINYHYWAASKWSKGSDYIKAGEDEVKEYIQFIKYGEEDEERGRPPMYSILKWLKYYENWLIDRMILNHERAKVVWIREEKGKSPQSSLNPMNAPKGGIILRESDNVRYRIESPKLESREAKTDGDAILYYIGSFRNFPLHILNQDASESVYNAIRKSDSPFGQMIISNQDFWRDAWKEMYRFVIKRKIIAGELKAEVRVPVYDETRIVETIKLVNEMIINDQEVNDVLKSAQQKLGKPKKVKIPAVEVPIDIVFPQMVNDNPLEVAKVLQIHRELGIASQSTLAVKAGYNWSLELQKLKNEKELGIDQLGQKTEPLKDDSGQPEDRDRGQTKVPDIKRK